MSFGKYEGDVVTKWLRHKGNDRNMELLEEFAYIAPDGKRWIAPAGSVVNGASIPQSLWQTVGAPYIGDYRRASVVHDVACVEKTETHEAVHLMFYNAMRADRVGWMLRAVLMSHFWPNCDGRDLCLRRGEGGRFSANSGEHPGKPRISWLN